MRSDPAAPAFWDREDLEEDLRRAFRLCRQCRLCAGLCPAFEALFQSLDAHAEQGAFPTREESERVVDLCFQCKLCLLRCPYAPPQEPGLDLPRLLLRALLVRKREKGFSARDRFLGNPELLGALGSLTVPFSNWACRQPLFRRLLERAFGLHRDRLLPPFQRDTFEHWFRKNEKKFRREIRGLNGKVVLFHTCLLNYCQPQIGRSAVAVLHHNDVEVRVPPQRCCGVHQLEAGDLEGARENLLVNVRNLGRFVDQGYSVVVPEPACGYMLRIEYPWIHPEEETHRVAAHTLDLGEYLLSLHEQGRLRTDFRGDAGALSCHSPCHLKAQGVGCPSRDLLALIPGSRVRLLDRCSGMGAAWGLKQEFFRDSLRVAERLGQEVEEERAPVISDCSRAGLQIRQCTGRAARHPVEVLREAYGLPDPG